MIMMFRRMGAALAKRQFGQMFYEFTLIFLAVMAGFAVDNWRENLEDKKRLKQYLTGLRADLQSDQREADSIIAKNNAGQADIRFITDQLYGTPTDSQLVEVYTKSRFLNGNALPFYIQDQVYSQMRSSGDLRLIDNKALSDSIGGYYFIKAKRESQESYRTSFLNTHIEACTEVFDGRIFLMLSGRDYDPAALHQAIKQLKTPINKLGLSKMIHSLQIFNGFNYSTTKWVIETKPKAQRLEAMISEELEKLE
jgi:hypothetical protein